MHRHRLLLLGLAAAIVLPAGLAAQADTSGPAAIHYKGVTLTPVAFFAAEGVFRQRNESADIGSNFGAIPFPNTTNGELPELRGSARQSRLGLLGQGKLNDVTLSGYFEGDFLSAGVTSNSNESNSYTLRVRQFFGQADFQSGWSVALGQMWSFLTNDKTGMAPRSYWSPNTIDAQYATGFDWTRNMGIRVWDKISDGVYFGVSAESPELIYTARGAPSNFVIGTAGGSLLNSTTNYSVDEAPDVIAKLAFEPKGLGHWEIKALGRVFRDRIYDPANAIGGTRNYVTEAGGLGIGAFVPFGNVLDFTLDGLWGRGIGRYGTSGLPDATVNSLSEIVPILGAHAIAALELHATSQLDVYGYGGVEYAARTADVLNGKGMGYGSPLLSNTGCMTEAAPTGAYVSTSLTGSPCNADNRVVYQGNLGFWYRFYRGPAGTFQWGLQYSYTARQAWVGGGAEPKATENMIFTSFRYYLP